jgi:hypothetical protein
MWKPDLALTLAEAILCLITGDFRILENKKIMIVDQRRNDFAGAVPELAWSKISKILWDGARLPLNIFNWWKQYCFDLGPFEIRGTCLDDRGMEVKRSDRDGSIVIMSQVYSTFWQNLDRLKEVSETDYNKDPVHVKFLGYLPIEDARKLAKLNYITGKRYVPRDKLRDLTDLKPILALIERRRAQGIYTLRTDAIKPFRLEGDPRTTQAFLKQLVMAK